MEDLIILSKAVEMVEYGYIVLKQFPKSEKFALAADIKKIMHKILEKIIEAQKKYYKKTTLQDLDVACSWARYQHIRTNELIPLLVKQKNK